MKAINLRAIKRLVIRTPILRAVAIKLRNLLIYYRYFYPPLMAANPAPITKRSRVLLIGGDSDIAKPFLAMLKSRGIDVLSTTRSQSIKSKNIDTAQGSTAFLNLSSASLFDNLNQPEFSRPFSHIISFVGKHDGTTEALQQPTADSGALSDTISSNATWLFQALQVLVAKHLSHYKSNHLCVCVLTTSFALDRFPMGLSGLGYRAGKSLLHILLTNFYLECRTAQLDLTVLLCGPGYVKTKMTGYRGDITSEKSASILLSNIQKYGGIKKMIFVSSSGKKRSII